MDPESSVALSSGRGEPKERIYKTGTFEDVGDERQNKVGSVESNNASKVGELAGASAAIGVWGLFLIVTTAISFATLYAVPLVIVNTGLAVSLSVQHEWQVSISHLNNTHDRHAFVVTANNWEETWNLLMIATEFGITFWDLCLGVLYILFDLFVNLCLLFFKLVFTDPVRAAAIWLLRTCATLAVTLMQSLTDNFGVAQEHTVQTSEPGLDPGETFGASFGTSSTSSSKDNAQKGYILFSALLQVFAFFDVKSWGEIVNYLVDPVFRNIKNWFKVIANFSAMIGNNGVWTKLFSTDMQRRQLDSVLGASECFSKRLWSNIMCKSFGWIYQAGQLIADLNLGSNPFKDAKCSMQDLGGCKVDNLLFSASGSDNIFSAGYCDEVECEYLVEDLYGNFALVNNTCAFWTGSADAAYLCMLMVNDYVNTNDTSSAKANPASLAAEICFVEIAQNLQSCSDTGLPFQFDVPAAANDVCSNTALGADFSACSCNYRAPLCDNDCCQSYANHVNLQVLQQIPDRTCAELYTYFPKDKVWCPLLANVTADSNAFPDNTYTHMWCSYYVNVLDALCQFAAPFTRIRDLDIAAVYATYAAGACNATVNQLGVCLPYNTTVDSLATEIVNANIPATDVFDLNDGLTYVPSVPIVTNFDMADTADSIYDKTRKKHFCEQYSIIYKNDNLMLRSQPWSVSSTASVFCDTEVLNSRQDINLFGSSTYYKFYNADGTATQVQLEGVNGMPAFGAGNDPNLNSPAGTCTGSVGTNINEGRLQDDCTHQLTIDGANLDSNIVSDSNTILTSWSQQQVNTDPLGFISGTVPLDPNSTNYMEQTLEIQRTVAVDSLDTDITDTPYNELRNVTDEWKLNYTNPPPEGAFNSNDPGAAFGAKDAVITGRFLLSVDPDTGKVPAPEYHKDLIEVMKEFAPWMGGLFSPTPTPMNKHARAYAYKIQKRLERVGERLHERVYGRHKREYEAQGYDLEKDVDHFTKTRKLMMTGNPVTDAQINEVFDIFADVPHTPLGITMQQFRAYVENDVVNRMTELGQLTGTTILPKIYISMFQFVNGDLPNVFDNETLAQFQNLSFYSNETFGDATNPPDCKNTVQKPYQCCKAASTPYECCRGLIGCLPDIPGTFYLTLTTEQNVDTRWDCTEVKTFFGWWTWLFRAIWSLIASLAFHTLGISALGGSINHHFPANLGPCMIVNSPFFFIGIDAVIAIFFFLNVQIFTLLFVLTANFRREQAADDAALNQHIDELQARENKDKNFSAF